MGLVPPFRTSSFCTCVRFEFTKFSQSYDWWESQSMIVQMFASGVHRLKEEKKTVIVALITEYSIRQEISNEHFLISKISVVVSLFVHFLVSSRSPCLFYFILITVLSRGASNKIYSDVTVQNAHREPVAQEPNLVPRASLLKKKRVPGNEVNQIFRVLTNTSLQPSPCLYFVQGFQE